MLRDTLDHFLADVLRLPVHKALDPNDPQDFLAICNQLAKATAGLTGPAEAAALKKALGSLDVDWKKMSPAAKAKVVAASKQALNPSKVILPKVEEHFEANAIKLGVKVKGSTKKTFGFAISPDLTAVQLKTLQAVALSQGNYVRDEYGKRSEIFGVKAKQIVAEELAKGSTQKEIVKRLHAELTSQQMNRSRAYWGVVANAFANRARTFVNLESFAEAGFTRFRFDAVRDERTSEICRFMHGREFNVGDALGAYHASEAKGGDVKRHQPWVQQTSVDGQIVLYVKDPGANRIPVAAVQESAAGKVDESGKSVGLDERALSKLGVMTPPLHGHCRSTIIPVKASAAPKPPRSFALQPSGELPPTPAPPPAAPAPEPPPEEQVGFAFGPGGVVGKPISIPLPPPEPAAPAPPPVKAIVPLKAKIGSAQAKLDAIPEKFPGLIPNPIPVKAMGISDAQDEQIFTAFADLAASGSSPDPTLFKVGPKAVGVLKSFEGLVNKKLVAEFIANPKLMLKHEVKVVKKGKEVFVYEGHDVIAACHLLEKWNHPVIELNLKALEKQKADHLKAIVSAAKSPPLPPMPKADPLDPPPLAALPPPTGKPIPGPPPTGLKHPSEPEADEIMHKPLSLDAAGITPGSNKGGLFEGKDGAKRYVKFYEKEPAQAHVEVLANALYQYVGIDAPSAVTFKKDGVQCYASKLLDGKPVGEKKVNGLAPKDAARDFFRGFAADVLLANFDAAGATMDNAFLLKSGKVARIDNGGALFMRAQGGKKSAAQLENVDLDAFFPGGPYPNPGYHAMAEAAGYKSVRDFKADFVKQVDALANVRKQFGGWDRFVDAYAPGMGESDRKEAARILNDRLKKLEAKALELSAAEAPAPKKKRGEKGELRHRAPPIKGIVPAPGTKIEDLPEHPYPEEWIANHLGDEDPYKTPPTLPGGERHTDYLARADKAMHSLTKGDNRNRNATPELAAIVDFTGSAYGSCREYEEAVGRGKSTIGMDHGKRVSEAANRAFKKADAEPRTVYRGISVPKEVAEAIITQEGVSRLGRFNTPGTSSSSWNPMVAVYNFMGDPKDDPSTVKILYQIHQKSGIPIERVSGGFHDKSGNNECEILLPKDAEFKIVSVARWHGKKRVLVIELEEI